MNKDIESAWEAACRVRERAHAPYSRFLVGASLKVEGRDTPFAGCNVENASFGGTICAERNAIFQAVAECGRFKPEFMVLVTDTDPVAGPCGMCLQIISEFCPGDFPIHLANLKGVQRTCTLDELFPLRFNLD